MAGPAFVTRLFGPPGVPRFVGTRIFTGTSIQFPRRRKRTSGHPASQRTFARIVAVPEDMDRTRVPRTVLFAVSPSPGARTCSTLGAVKPPVVSIELWL